MTAPGPRRFSRSTLPLVGALGVLLLLAALWWALAVWKPTPPSTLTMATGPEGGAYAEFGARYRAILARHGVDLRLLPTAGAVENLARLQDAGASASVGFTQGGLANAEDAERLVSLGTVFFEPLWLFHRGLDTSRGLDTFAGKRISIGPEGSGTRALALRLLAMGREETQPAEILALEPEEAADSLVRSALDAALMITAWESPVVRRLLAAPGIELASFPRADAHLALNPYLGKLLLPAGVADLGRNIPREDVVLVAPKASLVVRRDLHPALQYLLLEAASEIHSRPGVFHRAGEFPALEAIDLPLSDQARQFARSGRPWLQRHMPFWLAAPAERLLVLLVPLAGVAYPLSRALPAFYGWTVRRRVFHLYGELKLIELELERGGREEQPVLLERLNVLEQKARHMWVPRSMAWLVYTLRHHARLVRERVQGPA